MELRQFLLPMQICRRARDLAFAPSAVLGYRVGRASRELVPRTRTRPPLQLAAVLVTCAPRGSAHPAGRSIHGSRGVADGQRAQRQGRLQDGRLLPMALVSSDQPRCDLNPRVETEFVADLLHMTLGG